MLGKVGINLWHMYIYIKVVSLFVVDISGRNRKFDFKLSAFKIKRKFI